MNSEAVEILKEARKLLIEKGWTQAAYARDINGYRVSPRSTDAVCFCSIGAIQHVHGSWGVPERFLTRASEHAYWSVPVWNDKPGRTKEDVIALFDKAIEIGSKNET